VADELVGLAGALGGAGPLRRPAALGAGALPERVALVDVRPVVLLGMLAAPGALIEVRRPATVIAGERVGVIVDLCHRGHRSLQECPVVRDRDQRRRQPEDEPLQPLEAVEVQVVGGLVEQEHVEARQQQGRQLDPGRLTAREVRRGAVKHLARQAELGGHRPGAGVDVGAAEREPAVEGGGVRVVGPRHAPGEGTGGGVEAGAGGGHAGAPGQQPAHRLAVRGPRLLRQIADGGGRRSEANAAVLRQLETGEGLQESGLARPVGAHQPEAVAGGDDQLDVVEEWVGAGGNGQAADDEGGEVGRHGTPGA
jgi:hypothetical protein